MPSPFEDTLEAIRASGGVALQSRKVGKELSDFDFVIDTPAGLEFIAKHTVADEEIHSTLYSILPEPRFAYLKVYSDRHSPGHAFFFHSGFPSTLSLVVQLWGSNSTAIIYETSHLRSLESSFDKDISKQKGILAIHHDKLQMMNIPAKEINMDDGGVVLVDSQTGFVVHRGFCICIGFISNSKIQHPEIRVRKIQLHKSDAMVAKLQELEGRGLILNYEWIT
ncbi:hypothetical protein FGADI_4551 [Fusarium gaditjirri]|uniref:Uncharacterized protein n=1 Tax=Fusarium gaditjirri TaxID=282569 RepID=A0A8H4WZH7_9HYPO|nr:hypothetical protein FGADI_4551 [Fusarium gaditjirri]